jgi:hypothetical protein
MSLPFPLPMIFQAWGFRNPADKFDTPAELADYCDAAGCKTIAVQLGRDYSADVPNCTADEAQALRTRGFRVLVWGVASAAYVIQELQRLGASEADWLPQIEGPSQRDLVLEAASGGLTPSAIVTTYSGAGAENSGDVNALRNCGVRLVLVECYSEAGYPYTDLNRMLWQGTQYGWRQDELYACLGTYRGELPDAYTHTEIIGRNFGLYLAEPMSSEQFHAFGELNTKAPPPKPEPPTPEDDMDKVNDQQALQGANTHARGALQGYPDGPASKPRGRNTMIYRISHPDNTDEIWNKARDEMVAVADKYKLPAVD